MSTALNTEAFNRVELSREQALAYLHRDSLSLPEAPIGLLLLTYAGTPIGFVKNVGNRANNMYPTEWRIRKNPMEL
jgi:NOL1/NOP2/fmu family ribosome biogenesis protein